MIDEPIDYDAVRERFPWVGLVNTGEGDLSSRYREIEAEPSIRDAAQYSGADHVVQIGMASCRMRDRPFSTPVSLDG